MAEERKQSAIRASTNAVANGIETAADAAENAVETAEDAMQLKPLLTGLDK